MKEYYYVKGEERFGPFTHEQLKNENIQPSDLIWREGFADWMIASEVEEVKSIFKVLPPPIPKFAQKDLKIQPTTLNKGIPEIPTGKDNFVEEKKQESGSVSQKNSPVNALEDKSSKWNIPGLILTISLIIFFFFLQGYLPQIVGIPIIIALIISIWFAYRRF